MSILNNRAVKIALYAYAAINLAVMTENQKQARKRRAKAIIYDIKNQLYAAQLALALLKSPSSAIVSKMQDDLAKIEIELSDS